MHKSNDTIIYQYNLCYAISFMWIPLTFIVMKSVTTILYLMFLHFNHCVTSYRECIYMLLRCSKFLEGVLLWCWNFIYVATSPLQEFCSTLFLFLLNYLHMFLSFFFTCCNKLYIKYSVIYIFQSSLLLVDYVVNCSQPAFSIA